MSQRFIVTKGHRRFTEFAGAIRKDVTIGICHGEAGDREYAVVDVEAERPHVNDDVVLANLVVGVDRIDLAIGGHRVPALCHSSSLSLYEGRPQHLRHEP